MAAVRGKDFAMTDAGSERLQSIPAGSGREEYLPLLLLADDSETQVRTYMHQGDLFVLRGAHGEALGATLVILHGEGEAELKSVAVDRAWHGQGKGQQMLALVLAELRVRGIRRAVVGTGTSGIGQIAFYQKAGFRFWRIERDFFSPERGYPAGITENGIPLRDMVWLDQEL
jgi:ribosomal protein S18 acetylase RimI-like enzyme